MAKEIQVLQDKVHPEPHTACFGDRRVGYVSAAFVLRLPAISDEVQILEAKNGATSERLLPHNEKWGHPVTLKPFRIAKAAVSTGEYLAFVEAGGSCTARFDDNPRPRRPGVAHLFRCTVGGNGPGAALLAGRLRALLRTWRTYVTRPDSSPDFTRVLSLSLSLCLSLCLALCLCLSLKVLS